MQGEQDPFSTDRYEKFRQQMAAVKTRAEQMRKAQRRRSRIMVMTSLIPTIIGFNCFAAWHFTGHKMWLIAATAFYAAALIHGAFTITSRKENP